MRSPFELTLWQKKQATLLYHFSSLEYLKGLQKRFNDLLVFVDPTIDLAKDQNRDSVLVDKRWGNRNTSENWTNNAWPFLKDFQLDIAKDIANRAFEIYKVTGANQCARGMSEYSMQWMTPEEQEQFERMFDSLYSYASPIDKTLQKSQRASRWNDFRFTEAWQELKGQFTTLPKFQARTDIEGETEKVPVRTGVYIPRDDPHGSLQFAWTGGGHGILNEAPTFNDLGLSAINTVGRRDLWTNGARMLTFVQANKSNPLLQEDPFFNDPDTFTPESAPSVVARNAFTSRPCKWWYVEMVNGEFEDIEEDPSDTDAPQNRLRVEGGQRCPQAGYWYTPAKIGSRRYFRDGEPMSNFDSSYGSTVWQWDAQQD